jgi:hypothetical protein
MSTYYTTQQLENQSLREFQAGHFRNPLDIIHLGSLPPAFGAYTLPPMGAFSTERDVSNLSSKARNKNPELAVSPVLIAGGLTLAYLAFLPMKFL